MPYPEEWNRVIRRGGSRSGMHVYINGEHTEMALRDAGIPLNATELKVKAYIRNKKEKGAAYIMLRIKEVKK